MIENCKSSILRHTFEIECTLTKYSTHFVLLAAIKLRYVLQAVELSQYYACEDQ